MPASASRTCWRAVPAVGKMRVLLLVNRWYPDGGVENFLEQLVSETSGTVDYAIMSLTTSIDSDAVCDKLGPVLKSGRVQDMFTQGSAIATAMREGRYDAVHIQASNGSAFYLAGLAKKAGIPRRIIHSHNAGAEISGNPLKKAVGAACAAIWSGAPTGLWACSANAGEYLFGKRPFTVFFNGIDLDKFAFSEEKRARVRRELGVADGEFLLGSIGRIAMQKNPIFQLQVFAELRKLVPGARFCMVGSGDMEPERDAEAARLGLGESLITVPRSSESDAFYSAFDALIFPSAFEGLPFVGIEGQAEGLPIYGSDTLPRELAVTDRISFAPTDEGAAVWARRIAKGIDGYRAEERPTYADKMRAAGFDPGCFANYRDGLPGWWPMTQRRTRVLMVGPARNEQGGIATVVNDYYKAGIEDRCDVTFLPCTGKGGKPKKLAQGVHALAWERRHLRDFDVLHVHMGGGNSFARERFFAMAGVKAGVPTILHVHDGLFRDTYAKAPERIRAAYRRVFSSVDRVVALSDSWREYFSSEISSADNVVSIPNGIRIPADVKEPKEPGTVLFLGHFDDNKNARVLIRAIAKARESVPGVHAYFGADGDVEGAKALVSELGCGDACSVLGWVGSREKQALLDRCSIYCLPSKNEAFPMGLLEAMANGLAAVVTPVGGMRDIVQGGKTGVFVPVDDADALAEAIVGLCRDDAERARIAKAGAAMVRERYDLGAVVAELVGLYEELAGGEAVDA